MYRCAAVVGSSEMNKLTSLETQTRTQESEDRPVYQPVSAARPCRGRQVVTTPRSGWTCSFPWQPSCAVAAAEACWMALLRNSKHRFPDSQETLYWEKSGKLKGHAFFLRAPYSRCTCISCIILDRWKSENHSLCVHPKLWCPIWNNICSRGSLQESFMLSWLDQSLERLISGHVSLDVYSWILIQDPVSCPK